MPGTAPLNTLALVGNGATAAVLNGAGFLLMADVWEVDMDDDSIVRRLTASADRLSGSSNFQGVMWQNILIRAYNRMILISEALRRAERIELDVPTEFQCSISQQWPAQPVFTPRGHLYDRVWIERWIKSAGTDPLTRQSLTLADLREDPERHAEIKHARTLHAQGMRQCVQP